jgi:hypothetical protein
MNPLSHDELQEMLPEAALETLAAADLQLVMAHVEGCSECAGLLRDHRDIAASLTLMLPRQPLDPSRSAAIRERLLARARGAEGLSGVRRLFQVGRWSGWLVAAGLAGVLLMHHAVHRPLAYGWLAAGVLTILLVAVGLYARAQRSRAAALRDRLASLERETTKPAG